MAEVTAVLETGEKEVVRVKPGTHTFFIKLVDLPNTYVTIYKCVGGRCKKLIDTVTDEQGIVSFIDTVQGLSTIAYRFRLPDGRVFAELHVVPVIIDAEEAVRKVYSLLEVILQGLLLKMPFKTWR